MTWQIPSAIFATETTAGRSVHLTLETASGRAVLQNETVATDFHLPFPSYGRLEGRFTTHLATHVLNGHARLHLTQLDLVQVFTPQLEEVAGKVQGEARITGTWEQPLIDGQVSLTRGTMRLPKAGIRLKDVELHAVTDTSGIVVLRGRASSAPGRLQFQGIWRQTPEPRLQLSVSGERFLAADLPHARVRVSPDLRIKVTAAGVDVRGRLHIPEAHITLNKTLLPGQEPGMVSVSADEVIVGRSPRPQPQPLKATARIRLTLGKQVFFDASPR